MSRCHCQDIHPASSPLNPRQQGESSTQLLEMLGCGGFQEEQTTFSLSRGCGGSIFWGNSSIFMGIFMLTYCNIMWLVVSTPLKNMKVSWGYYFQYIEKYTSCSKPPTSCVILVFFLNSESGFVWKWWASRKAAKGRDHGSASFFLWTWPWFRGTHQSLKHPETRYSIYVCWGLLVSFLRLSYSIIELLIYGFVKQQLTAYVLRKANSSGLGIGNPVNSVSMYWQWQSYEIKHDMHNLTVEKNSDNLMKAVRSLLGCWTPSSHTQEELTNHWGAVEFCGFTTY